MRGQGQVTATSRALPNNNCHRKNFSQSKLPQRPTSTATMKQDEADQLARNFIVFLETGTVPEGLFAEDVFCDFTLPKWRLQAEGKKDVVQMRLGPHPGQGKVPRWRCDPTPSGFVLELEERWTDNDNKKWYCREMFRADVRDDSIVSLSVYCTGDWDEELEMKHKASVKLIRP